MMFLGDKQREDELFYALAQEFNASPEIGQGEATPEVKVESQVDALASVIETLVKCANTLDQLGHPAAQHVDKILSLIEKDFVATEANPSA